MAPSLNDAAAVVSNVGGSVLLFLPPKPSAKLNSVRQTAIFSISSAGVVWPPPLRRSSYQRI